MFAQLPLAKPDLGSNRHELNLLYQVDSTQSSQVDPTRVLTVCTYFSCGDRLEKLLTNFMFCASIVYTLPVYSYTE